jgi:hypothetical protein
MALEVTTDDVNEAALYDFYDRELRRVLLEQERLRKALQRNFFIATGTSIGLLFWLRGDTSWVATFVYIAIVVWIAYRWNAGHFRYTFKRNVISKLVTFFGEELYYSARGCVPQTLFKNSRLFHDVENFGGEDLVSGKIDGLRFAFSEIHFTSKNALFRGMFFAIELPTEAKRAAFLYPQRAIKPYLAKYVQRVKLEDPHFERTFDVYAEDQVAARVLLTTHFMEQVMALRKLCNQTPYVSFSHRHLYIAVPSYQNLLEPSLFQSVLDPTTVRRFLSEFEVVLSIAQEVRLQHFNR